MARSKGLSQRRIMWRQPFASPRALLGRPASTWRLLAAGCRAISVADTVSAQLILAINEAILVVQGIVLTVSILVVAINFFFDFIIICRPRSAVSNFSLADAASWSRAGEEQPLGCFFDLCFLVGLNIICAIFATSCRSRITE